MKQVVLGAILGLSLPIYVAAQLWREPYTDLHGIAALDAPGSPIVLSDGTLSLRHPLDLMRVLIGVRARDSRAINSSGVTLRLAAGPFEDRMLTIRLVESPKQPPALLPRRGIEGVDRFNFERVPEDPPIDTMSIRRDTKVVITVERCRYCRKTHLRQQGQSRAALGGAHRQALSLSSRSSRRIWSKRGDTRGRQTA